MQIKTKGETLPTELVILAGVLITLGALALGQTVYSFLTSISRELDLRILFIAAGLGLIKLSPYWRKFTQTISIFYLVFTLIPLIIGLIRWNAPYAQGTPIMDQVFYWVYTLVTLGASGWALYVLKKPSIGRLFSGR